MISLFELLAFFHRTIGADRASGRKAKDRRELRLEDGLEPRQLLTFDLKSVLFAPQAADQFTASTTAQDYVVSFSKPQNTANLAVKLGASSVQLSPFLENGYLIRYPNQNNVMATSEQISALPDFQYLYPEVKTQLQKYGVPNDPLFGDQWHLQNTGQGGGTVGIDANVVDVWDQFTGAGVTILISDDAVELTQEDLLPNLGPAFLHYDYVDGDPDPSPPTANDNHGTAVAGVAAARGNNALGVSGSAPNAEIAAVRIIGRVSDTQLAGAASHQNQIVDVSNNSWGYGFFMSTLGPQEAAAYRNGVTQGRNGLGVVYVFSAGNSRATEDNVNYHGQQGSRYTITVGAIANNGNISNYSTPGAKILVSAPSNGGSLSITTTDRTGDAGYNAAGAGDGDPLADVNYTSTFGGTSSAAPLVSGVIALMLEANPRLTWLEVQDILVESSRQVNPFDASWAINGAGHPFSHDYGFGMIDAEAAVDMALSYAPMRPEVTSTISRPGLNLAIPDNTAAPTVQTVDFSGSVQLTHVQLTVNASHARRGDLEIALVSPSGTRSILAEDRTRDNGSDYSNWTFTSVAYWDELAAGAWTVQVRDLVSGNAGTLDSFSLTFYGTDPDIPVPSKPQVVSPIGTISDTAPTYQWTTSANAASYELEVANSRGNVILARTGLTVTTFAQPTQLAEDTYSVRVRAVNSENEFSEWSDVVTFTVDVPSPAKPRILRPIGDITESFPTFEWTTDVNSSNYNIWVNNAKTQQRVIYRTAHAGTTYVHFDPLPDGVYRAWVKAFNTVGESSAWSDVVEFRIDALIPVAPKITAPTPVTTNPNPRIVWNAVEGAGRYDLWVNNLTTGTAQYIRRQDISRLTPYYDPPTMAQGSYTAWVRAANGNNEFSPWSAGYSFTVDVLPPAIPKMTGPTGPNGSLTVTTTNPTFTWTAADRAAKYDLWVNNVTTGQTQIIREQNLTDTKYVALTLLTQGNYRAWVRGINSANEVGEWSTAHSFTLDEPIPSIPVITAPVANPAGSVENPNPTFAWTAEFDAPFYEFRLDDVTLNKTNVIRVSNLTAKSYTIPVEKRLAEHIYSATVRGINSSGEMSDWSAPYQVRIDVPNPSTPTLISPTGTSKDTTPTFQWSHDQGSVRYEILVRDLERNETIVLQVKTFVVDPTGKIAFYTLPDNKAFKTGTYRFWIRAFNSLGTSSSWSNSKTFVISASLDLKDLKLVEPARLQAVEEYYAAVEIAADPESETAEVGTIETSASAMSVTERAQLPVSDTAMPLAAIEELMESLADPSSAASTMLSGSLLSDSATESQTNKTSAAAASILALAMMPVRRKRREA